MNDRPNADELVAAARQFLESELIPSLTDARLRFQALVTANVLGIVERELPAEETQLREEHAWLADLLGLPESPPERLSALKEAVRAANEELCKRIQSGAFDERSRFLTVIRGIRRGIERKLEVANPRYLASFSATAAKNQ